MDEDDLPFPTFDPDHPDGPWLVTRDQLRAMFAVVARLVAEDMTRTAMARLAQATKGVN